MKTVIIGGGASGLIASVFAARRGDSVTVLEAGKKPGLKLLKTGNGRCNLTNLKPVKYYGDSAFAERAVTSFSAEDTISFFHMIGVECISKDGWIYPRSEQASSVLTCLLWEMERLNVKLKCNERVESIEKKASVFLIHTGSWRYEADRVILACGSTASLKESPSIPLLKAARDLGHATKSFRPSLVPLKCGGIKCSRWAGVRVIGTITLESEGAKAASESGQLQFTEYGISGIPVFNISSPAEELLHAGKPLFALINFCPDQSLSDLKSLLKKRQISFPNWSYDRLLTGLFPEKLIPVLVEGVSSTDELAERICSFRVRITGTLDLERSQVAKGGVDTEDVDPLTMESKIVPGLYFAGEILNVDGPCGGYNLQFAWATGALAGSIGNPGIKNPIDDMLNLQYT